MCTYYISITMAMICFFVYIGHDPLGKLSDHFNNYLWARFASTREERRENSVQGGGQKEKQEEGKGATVNNPQFSGV